MEQHRPYAACVDHSADLRGVAGRRDPSLIAPQIHAGAVSHREVLSQGMEGNGYYRVVHSQLSYAAVLPYVPHPNLSIDKKEQRSVMSKSKSGTTAIQYATE